MLPPRSLIAHKNSAVAGKKAFRGSGHTKTGQTLPAKGRRALSNKPRNRFSLKPRRRLAGRRLP